MCGEPGSGECLRTVWPGAHATSAPKGSQRGTNLVFGQHAPALTPMKVDDRVWTPARHPLARLLRDVAAGRFREADGGWTRVSPWSQQHQAIIGLTGHAVLAVSYDVTDDQLADLGVDGFGAAHHPAVVGALAGPNGWIDRLEVLLLGVGTGSDGHQSLVTRPELAKHPLVEHVRRTCQNLQVMGSREPHEHDVVVISQGVAGLRQISVAVAPEHLRQHRSAHVIGQALSCVPESELVVASVAPGNAVALRAALAAGFVPVGSVQLFSTRRERSA